MTNMVKMYITDYLHDDVADYDVQRIVSIVLGSLIEHLVIVI